MDARLLFAAGRLGKLATAEELAALEAGDATSQAWAVALRAQRAGALGEVGPTIEQVAATTGEAFARAAYEGARERFARLDAEGLRPWVALLEKRSGDGEHERLAAPLVAAMGAWLRGEQDVALDSLATDARAIEESEWVADANSLIALFALSRGDLDEARKVARRASRIARTEALPQSEYLANIALAAVRRYSGYPHLSGRILGALQRLASPRWHAWLAWDALLSGLTFEEVPEGAAACLATMLRERDVTRFREAAERCAREPMSASMRTELARVRAALDVDEPALADAAAFVRGESHTLSGLHPASQNASRAHVFARVDAPGRRVLAPGHEMIDAEVLSASTRMGQRREKLVSTLALLGPEGGQVAEVFELVYGFRYVLDMHRGTFDVLLHRCRSSLASLAEIERDGEHLVLRVHEPFLIEDPRIAESPEERLLRAIADGTNVGSEAAAKAAGVPLRQAQAMLAQLVSEGAVGMQRAGRSRTYRVEDTTFSEPTTKLH